MGRSRRILAFVALGLVPAVAACQLVLGLNDYTTGDAGLSDFPDTGADSPSDGSTDAFVLPEVYAADTGWATFQMPNPLDAGATGNANYNVGVFSKLSADASGDATLSVWGDKFVGRDSGTGFLWLVSSAPQTANTIGEADAICKSEGARLPTRIELVTLLDYSRGESRRMSDIPLPTDGPYWTSSLYRPYDPKIGVEYWMVSFSKSDSLPVTHLKEGLHSVVCVVRQ